MTATTLCDWPATKLARHLKRGSVSSEAAVTACLSRIDALDGTLRAFVTVDAKGALDAARAADARQSYWAKPTHRNLRLARSAPMHYAGRRQTRGIRI